MPQNAQMRADAALVAQGLAPSRTRAQELIKSGYVFADGRAVQKCAQPLPPETVLEVRGDVCPYVSRGGFKLAKALESFRIDPCGMVCIDVGASTGGFTDVLLRNGAKLVYAVDVGSSQLDAQIAADPRVVRMDHVNARDLTPDQFPVSPQLAVMDVSFISILKILPALRSVLGSTGQVLSLIKPQFEAGRNALNRHGIVTDSAEHRRVLSELILRVQESGWCIRGYDFSPISGGDGNIEFLAHIVPFDPSVTSPDAQELRALVDRSHNALHP